MAWSDETTEQVSKPSDRALAALAAKAGCDPVDLETPLFEGVDPEALDAVLGRPTANHEVYVGFSIDGHGVQVHGDGAVYVDGERYDPDADAFEAA
jgi:hypothetical protein